MIKHLKLFLKHCFHTEGAIIVAVQGYIFFVRIYIYKNVEVLLLISSALKPILEQRFKQ